MKNPLLCVSEALVFFYSAHWWSRKSTGLLEWRIRPVTHILSHDRTSYYSMGSLLLRLEMRQRLGWLWASTLVGVMALAPSEQSRHQRQNHPVS